QRETLKRYGARFSSRRRAWYYVGWELPDGIQRLITHITETRSTEAEAASETAAIPTMSPELEAQILEALARDDAAADENESASAEDTDSKTAALTEAETPAVRVMKPVPIPAYGTSLDEVQSAIVQAKAQPTPVLHQ